MTIDFMDGTENLFVFATPVPYCWIDDDGEMVEVSLEELNNEDDFWYANDTLSPAIKVALEGGHIVCDIPDNYALFVTDNEEGGSSDSDGAEFVVWWSKR